MRFVIKSVQLKTEWSGDDSEFRSLQDSLIDFLDDVDVAAPIAPPPNVTEMVTASRRRAVPREYLPLFSILSSP
jgi:hypothetical protein